MDRYLNQLSANSERYSIMDLLTKKEARQALNAAKPEEIFTNFVY